MVVDTLSGTEDSLRQDFEKRTDREALPSNRGKRSAAAVQQLSPAAKTASATGSESSYRSFTVAARKRGVDSEIISEARARASGNGIPFFPDPPRKPRTLRTVSLLFAGLALAVPAFSQLADRYALVLHDEPVAARYASRLEMQSADAAAYRQRIQTSQSSLRGELEARHFTVTGLASSLVNAVFVAAPTSRVDELKALPGVKGVVRLRKYKASLNKAVNLISSTGSAADVWNLLGGMASSGKGIKIGIIDSGIDQNHPSLQDNTLTAPAGFPKCGTPSDCANFTNTKVIVARSYVKQLALGTGAINPATSRADDYSARDRSGHGTAVATCAAGNTSTGSVAIAGMAPKAYVGNYKIFGSPQINDFATDDVIVAALDDAINDGMDLVSMSVGGAALTGPLDTGAACGNPAGVACDVSASAFEAAAQKGMLILVAAGNEGYNGLFYPTFNSISSPGDAPSVIAVGGSSNAHSFTPAVRIPGAAVPANLNLISAYPGDSFSPYGAYAAPLVDIANLGNDGYACAALPAKSLLGDFALIQRGPFGAGACTFLTKMTNAVNAGAAGVIFYDYSGSSDFPFSASGLSNFTQPADVISNADGVNLKAFIDAHPGYSVVLDPAVAEVAVSPFNQLVFYSSMGPSLGVNGIKPDVLAPAGGGQNGDLIYMGAQNYDPLGEVYSATGYIAAAGTSFATPLAAGSAALVKQNHPGYTAAQIKSALVNTATQDVTTDDSGAALDILQTGAGKVAADLAIKTNLTVVPSTISFGALKTGALPLKQALTFTNTGSAAMSLTLAVVSRTSSAAATLALDNSTFAVASGATATVNVTLSGTVPAAGLYYGLITIAGASVPMQIPWMYLVGSTVPANFTPLAGDRNDGTVGQVLPDGAIAFQATDANGVPIQGAAVTFTVNAGSIPVILSQASTTTDAYGIAYVTPTVGAQTGTYRIDGCLGTCSSRNQFEYTFSGTARNVPAISTGGIVGADGFNPAAPVAPGSYIAIYGSFLSDVTDQTTTARLPLAMDYVNVSFDVPAAGISVPAHIVFVSPGQVNVQVPWELQGRTSAQVKVTIDQSVGNVVTVPIANYSPEFFQYPYGSGTIAAVDLSGQVITSSNPAKRGAVVELYANGLGPVSNQPASGDTASATNLSHTTTLPDVSIGGQPAQVGFSGLTPGLPGLYQLNVTIPSNVSAGAQPVILNIGGVTAKTASLPVQ
jgi:minor extracellular serine protease Vpr